jgi:hypothetical protein
MGINGLMLVLISGVVVMALYMIGVMNLDLIVDCYCRLNYGL